MPGIEGSRLRRLEVRGRGLRAITRFTTVLAVLVGVVELGLRVILGMVAGIGVDPVYANLPLVRVALITASLVVAFRAGARLERDAVRVI